MQWQQGHLSSQVDNLMHLFCLYFLLTIGIIEQFRLEEIT